MSEYVEKLTKLAAHYKKILTNQFIKSADQDTENVKKIIKGSIDRLDDSIEGVLYPTNITVQRTVDGVYVHFLLNLDIEKQNELNLNKIERDKFLQTDIKNQLEKYFASDVRLQIGEYWTKAPGWFESTPEN